MFGFNKTDVSEDNNINVIKFEGDRDCIVWKYPVEDFNYGSQLIVHESQEAVFFKDGKALDLFGSGRYTLETQRLPMLQGAYKLPTDNYTPFHAEVYFVNIAVLMGIKWGTDSKVRLFDPLSGLHVEIGACGEFNIRVNNSRKLLNKVIGTSESLYQSQIIGDDGKGYFRAMVMTQVKSYLASAIKEIKISILEIDEKLIELSENLKHRLNEYLFEYGLEMPEFFVSRIVTPDDEPNFKRVKEQFAEQYLTVRQEQILKNEAEAAQQRKTVEAQTEAHLKMIAAQGDAEALRIRKAAEADAYRMKAEVEAAEMRLKGYTYQQETARQVGMEAMQNGIGGSVGVGNSVGELAGLGVSLGALGGIMGMTKEAIGPVMNAASEFGQAIGGTFNDTWNCKCGQKNVVGRFCGNCGAERPSFDDMWDCSCGQKRISGNFCSNCGKKRNK